MKVPRVCEQKGIRAAARCDDTHVPTQASDSDDVIFVLVHTVRSGENVLLSNQSCTAHEGLCVGGCVESPQCRHELQRLFDLVAADNALLNSVTL